MAFAMGGAMAEFSLPPPPYKSRVESPTAPIFDPNPYLTRKNASNPYLTRPLSARIPIFDPVPTQLEQSKCMVKCPRCSNMHGQVPTPLEHAWSSAHPARNHVMRHHRYAQVPTQPLPAPLVLVKCPLSFCGSSAQMGPSCWSSAHSAILSTA